MRIIRIMAATIVVLAIVVFFGEIFVKIYIGLKDSTDTIILTGDDKIYAHRPCFSFTNKHGIKIHYNSIGLVGSEIPPKKDGVIRVLGFGDSITEGTYLPQNVRYLHLLETILNRRTGKRVEVLNAGVSGYNSWQELALLRQLVPKLKPDVVLIGICINDSVRTTPARYVNLFGRLIPVDVKAGSKARYLDFLYQHSSFYRLFYDAVSTFFRDTNSKKGYYEYLRNYDFPLSSSDLIEWQKPLKDMYEFCAVYNIKIVFIIFPLHSQLVKGEVSSSPGLTEYFSRNKMFYLDLIYPFQLYYNDNGILYRNKDIIHPSAVGHAVSANAIAMYLIDNNILGE